MMNGLLHALRNADATGPALIVCMIVLWYGIAWRVLVLSAWRPNRLIGAPLGWQARLPFGRALVAIRDEARRTARPTAARLDAAVGPYRLLFSGHNKLVQSTAMIAPLLGLLGTVMGMIDTFATMSVADQAARGNGVAAGIAEALTATELGLVVAVPGLLIGSLLERRQHQLTSLLELEVERVVGGATC
jgi:biopolymer transport protein ExbB